MQKYIFYFYFPNLLTNFNKLSIIIYKGIINMGAIVEFLFNVAAIVIFNKLQASQQKKNQLVFNLPKN